MRSWTIIKSHPVANIPTDLLGDTIDDIRDRMQEMADCRNGYGTLSFKVFNKPTGRELHSFFLDRRRRRRPFIKARESCIARKQETDHASSS